MAYLIAMISMSGKMLFICLYLLFGALQFWKTEAENSSYLGKKKLREEMKRQSRELKRFLFTRKKPVGIERCQ